MLYSAFNQVSIFDLSAELDALTSHKSDQLFSLFNQFINIEDAIPASFHNAYYSDVGKNRDFPLEGMIKALVFYNLLGLPTISTLIFIISISSDFRKFLNFTRAPHPSQFSRFKSNFYNEILNMFHHLVDFSSELADLADETLSKILITDTTGFELYVKENNPKFYQSILKTVKTYAKTNKFEKSFDVEKYAQSKLPKHSASNPEAKLTYLNGHFGYYQKVILSTNGFGLIRDINFYGSDNTLDLDLTPEQTKDQYDAKSLIPSLETFFDLHPSASFNYFLGDSGFDAVDNYAYLYKKDIIPIISLNPRNNSKLPQPFFTEDGIPTCPNNSNLPMTYVGVIKGKNRADRIKYACPKRSFITSNYVKSVVLDCDNPCTNSPYGRIKNITVHHNYRFNAAMPRNSDEWINLYKFRTVCERTIAQLKSFMQINISKINKTLTLKANILMAGITQLIAFIILQRSKSEAGRLAVKSMCA